MILLSQKTYITIFSTLFYDRLNTVYIYSASGNSKIIIYANTCGYITVEGNEKNYHFSIKVEPLNVKVMKRSQFEFFLVVAAAVRCTLHAVAWFSVRSAKINARSVKCFRTAKTPSLGTFM